MRLALARKREAEKSAKEKAKLVAAQQEQERVAKAVAVAGVNHLEIPAELAFIFSKLDGTFPFLFGLILADCLWTFSSFFLSNRLAGCSRGT